ncbi:MAG TPA: hypothetical protein VLI93_00085 [Acetobacteraceae bacterium]|nr:hypothetical protein [Acetobacteraceae bacterium]
MLQRVINSDDVNERDWLRKRDSDFFDPALKCVTMTDLVVIARLDEIDKPFGANRHRQGIVFWSREHASDILIADSLATPF